MESMYKKDEGGGGGKDCAETQVFTGKILPGGRFLDLKNILRVLCCDSALSRIPSGLKNNVYFVCDYQRPGFDYIDEYPWIVDSCIHKNLYLCLANNALKRVFFKSGLYVAKVSSHSGESYKSLDPQPSHNDILEIQTKSFHLSHCPNYKKRLTWISRMPVRIWPVVPKTICVEYLGSYQEEIVGFEKSIDKHFRMPGTFQQIASNKHHDTNQTIGSDFANYLKTVSKPSAKSNDDEVTEVWNNPENIQVDPVIPVAKLIRNVESAYEVYKKEMDSHDLMSQDSPYNKDFCSVSSDVGGVMLPKKLYNYFSFSSDDMVTSCIPVTPLEILDDKERAQKLTNIDIMDLKLDVPAKHAWTPDDNENYNIFEMVPVVSKGSRKDKRCRMEEASTHLSNEHPDATVHANDCLNIDRVMKSSSLVANNSDVDTCSNEGTIYRNGKPLEEGSFLDLKSLLQAVVHDTAVDYLPKTMKSDVYFIYNYSSDECCGKSGRIIDLDDGETWSECGSTELSFVSDKGLFKRCYFSEGSYHELMLVRGQFVYAQLKPQPLESDIIEIKRNHATSALSCLWRRITWIKKVPSAICSKNLPVVCIEYVGSPSISELINQRNENVKETKIENTTSVISIGSSEANSMNPYFSSLEFRDSSTESDGYKVVSQVPNQENDISKVKNLLSEGDIETAPIESEAVLQSFDHEVNNDISSQIPLQMNVKKGSLKKYQLVSHDAGIPLGEEKFLSIRALVASLCLVQPAENMTKEPEANIFHVLSMKKCRDLLHDPDWHSEKYYKEYYLSVTKEVSYVRLYKRHGRFHLEDGQLLSPKLTNNILGISRHRTFWIKGMLLRQISWLIRVPSHISDVMPQAVCVEYIRHVTESNSKGEKDYDKQLVPLELNENLQEDQDQSDCKANGNGHMHIPELAKVKQCSWEEGYSTNCEEYSISVGNTVGIPDNPSIKHHPFVKFVDYQGHKLRSLILYTEEQILDLCRCCSASCDDSYQHLTSVLGIETLTKIGNMNVTVMTYPNSTIVSSKSGKNPIFLGPIFIHRNVDIKSYSLFLSHISCQFQSIDVLGAKARNPAVVGSGFTNTLIKAISKEFKVSDRLVCKRDLENHVLKCVEKEKNTERPLLKQVVDFLFDENGIGSTSVTEKQLNKRMKGLQNPNILSELRLYFGCYITPHLKKNIKTLRKHSWIAAPWSNSDVKVTWTASNQLPEKEVDRVLYVLVNDLYEAVTKQFNHLEQVLIGCSDSHILSHEFEPLKVDQMIWSAMNRSEQQVTYKKFLSINSCAVSKNCILMLEVDPVNLCETELISDVQFPSGCVADKSPALEVHCIKREQNSVMSNVNMKSNDTPVNTNTKVKSKGSSQKIKHVTGHSHVATIEMKNGTESRSQSLEGEIPENEKVPKGEIISKDELALPESEIILEDEITTENYISFKLENKTIPKILKGKGSSSKIRSSLKKIRRKAPRKRASQAPKKRANQAPKKRANQAPRKKASQPPPKRASQVFRKKANQVPRKMLVVEPVNLYETELISDDVQYPSCSVADQSPGFEVYQCNKEQKSVICNVDMKSDGAPRHTRLRSKASTHKNKRVACYSHAIVLEQKDGDENKCHIPEIPEDGIAAPKGEIISKDEIFSPKCEIIPKRTTENKKCFKPEITDCPKTLIGKSSSPKKTKDKSQAPRKRASQALGKRSNQTPRKRVKKSEVNNSLDERMNLVECQQIADLGLRACYVKVERLSKEVNYKTLVSDQRY